MRIPTVPWVHMGSLAEQMQIRKAEHIPKNERMEKIAEFREVLNEARHDSDYGELPLREVGSKMKRYSISGLYMLWGFCVEGVDLKTKEGRATFSKRWWYKIRE